MTSAVSKVIRLRKCYTCGVLTRDQIPVGRRKYPLCKTCNFLLGGYKQAAKIILEDIEEGRIKG